MPRLLFVVLLLSPVAAFAGPISNAPFSATCIQSTGPFPPPGSPFEPNKVVDQGSISGILPQRGTTVTPPPAVASICGAKDAANNSGLEVAGFHVVEVGTTGVFAELLAQVRRAPGNNFYGMSYTMEATLQGLIPLVVWGGSGTGTLQGTLSAVGDGDLTGQLNTAAVRWNATSITPCSLCPAVPFSQTFTFGVPFVWTLDATLAFQGGGFGAYSVATLAEFNSILDSNGRAVAGGRVEAAPEAASWILTIAGVVILTALSKFR